MIDKAHEHAWSSDRPWFRTKYITGIGALDQRMVIPVDIERLMSAADMALMSKAA